MKLNYARKELKAKEAEIRKTDEGYKSDREAFEAVQKMKITLENQMKELNYSGLYRFLIHNFGAICKGVRKCRELTLTMPGSPKLFFHTTSQLDREDDSQQ